MKLSISAALLVLLSGCVTYPPGHQYPPFESHNSVDHEWDSQDSAMFHRFSDHHYRGNIQNIGGSSGM